MVDNNYMKCYSTLFVSSMKCVSQQSILCPYVLQVQLTQSRSRQRQAPRIALHTNVATAMGRKYSRGKIIFQSSFKIHFSFSAIRIYNDQYFSQARRLLLQWLPWILRYHRPQKKITRKSILIENKLAAKGCSRLK